MRLELDDTARAALRQLGCTCADVHLVAGDSVVVGGTLMVPVSVVHDETCVLLARHRRIAVAPLN